MSSIPLPGLLARGMWLGMLWKRLILSYSSRPWARPPFTVGDAGAMMRTAPDRFRDRARLNCSEGQRE